jgi:O-antigen ligase
LVALSPVLKDSFILFQRLDRFDDSYKFRAYIWNEAYDIYNKHKFLGIGIGNYKDYVGRYSGDQYFLFEDNNILIFDQPENGYLKILTELGAFGFIISFLMILIPIAKALYAHFTAKKNYILLLFIAPIICWFISFNSLYTLSDSRIIILFVSLICFIIKSPYTHLKKAQTDLVKNKIFSA